MSVEEISFLNKTKIRIQAQIFSGRQLISTCVADPGEMYTLQCGSAGHDIYCRHASTGWEIAHKRNNKTISVTLSQQRERFILS